MADVPAADAHNEYHRFVGSFISEYARLEFVLRYVLERLSGMTPETYRVMIGFPRSGEVIKKVRQLAETRNLDEDAKASLDDAFSQLTQITAIRDRIVHYGGHPLTDGDVLVFMKPRPEANHDQFTQQTLWNAVIDLNLINRIVLFRLGPREPAEWINAQELNGVRREPWRYKPPESLQNRR